MRHEPNDFGHIGFGIRPSAHRRGLATWALGRMLDEARALGLDRVLLTCKADNIASARAIEHHGGVLEDVRDTELGTYGATGSRSSPPAGPPQQPLASSTTAPLRLTDPRPTSVPAKGHPLLLDGPVEGTCTLPPMAFASKLSLVGLVLALVFFIAGWTTVPTRVTFGAGSMRCGTSLNPSHDLDLEGDVCIQAGRERLSHTAWVAAILAAVGMSPLALRGWIESRRWLRWLVTSSLVAFWVVAVPLGLFVITRAYDAT